MPGLKRWEFFIVAFLTTALISGFAVSAHQKLRAREPISIGRFAADKAGLEDAEESIRRAGIVDINSAGVEELMRLKGIGRVLAERIVAYRSENGNFSTVLQLKNVKGIGDKLFNGIKDERTAQ